MYINSEFDSWVKQNVNNMDYVVIEPPCLNKGQYSYIWSNIGLIDIFQTFDIKYLFMWVDVNTLPRLFTVYQESDYEFKALLPWVKITKTDNLFYTLTNTLKSNVEYLAVFQKPNVPKLKFNDKNIIVDEQDSYTHKPKKWEEYLQKQLSYSGLEGIYIHSNGDYEKLISIDQDDEPKVHKTELF